MAELQEDDRYSYTLPEVNVYDREPPSPPPSPPVAAGPAGGEYIITMPPGHDRLVKPPTVSAGEAAGETATDALRSGVNSMWFGGGNRIVGGVNYLAGTSKAGSLGGAIDEAVAEEEAGRARSPYGSAGGEIAGGIASGLALPGSTATTLPGKIWYGMKAGTALGAAQGAGNTYTGNPADYVGHALTGGIYGGLLGGAMPIMGSIAGGARRVTDNIRREIPRPLAEAGQTDRGGLERILAERNPNAMLVDTPAMMAQGQGAVTSTGPGGAALREAVTRRQDFAGPRVLESADQIYGRAVVPEHVERQIGERMQALGPRYEEALDRARAVDTGHIANWMDTQAINERGPAQTAFQRARAMLDITSNPGNLDPHPRVLQRTRTAVQGLEGEARRAGNDEAANAYAAIDRRLNQELEDKVPGWRQLNSEYAELGTQQRAIRNDSAGARIFETGRTNAIHPEVLRETIAEAAQPKGANVGPSGEAFRLAQASRAELDRRITNKPSVVTLNQVLGKDEADIANARRLEIALGRPQKEQLDAVREAEALYKDRHDKIVAGSQTAHKTDAKESQEIGLSLPKSGAQTLYGEGKAALFRYGQDLLEATNLSSRDRIASILATHSPAELQVLIPKILAELPTRESRIAVTEMLVNKGLIGGSANVVGKRRNQPL